MPPKYNWKEGLVIGIVGSLSLATLTSLVKGFLDFNLVAGLSLAGIIGFTAAVFFGKWIAQMLKLA